MRIFDKPMLLLLHITMAANIFILVFSCFTFQHLKSKMKILFMISANFSSDVRMKRFGAEL